MARPDPEQRCPVCGQGVFTDVAYEDPDANGPKTRLDAESREILMFSCGHEVRGARMDVAEPDRMTVERRGSDEATLPPQAGAAPPAGPTTAPTEEDDDAS